MSEIIRANIRAEVDIQKVKNLLDTKGVKYHNDTWHNTVIHIPAGKVSVTVSCRMYQIYVNQGHGNMKVHGKPEFAVNDILMRVHSDAEPEIVPLFRIYYPEM